MLSLLLLNAVVNAAPSMGTDPAQRDSQCMVAVRAEKNLGPLAGPAAAYFEMRLNSEHDPEVVELLTISAEEAILPNTNRRENRIDVLAALPSAEASGQTRSAAKDGLNKPALPATTVLDQTTMRTCGANRLSFIQRFRPSSISGMPSIWTVPASISSESREMPIHTEVIERSCAVTSRSTS